MILLLNTIEEIANESGVMFYTKSDQGYAVYKMTPEGITFKVELPLPEYPEEEIIFEEQHLSRAKRVVGIEKDITLNLSMA